LKTALAIARRVQRAEVHSARLPARSWTCRDHRRCMRWRSVFRPSDDARLKNHVIDGRRFLHDTASVTTDLLDAYARSFPRPRSSPPRVLPLARSKLKEDGVLIANFYAAWLPIRGRRSMRWRTMRAAFRSLCHRHVIPKRGAAEFHLCRAQRLNPERRLT